MLDRSKLLWGAIAYGFLVLLGAALNGFVAAPAIACAAGLFTIHTDAQATFSFLTLKAIPFLWGLSVLAALSYGWVARLSLRHRALSYGVSTFFVWVSGPAIAGFILG